MGKYCIGVDLGGTSTKMGLFTEAGKLITKWSISTEKSDHGSHILSDINASINNKISQSDIDKSDVIGIGIGVPGPVTAEGTVTVCVNLGWTNVPVAKDLSSMSGLKVRVENDANIAALGEMWQGSAKGYKSLVLITLGTGIGGGVIIEGKIVSGLYGAAGEFGHMPIVPDITEVCGCGRRGCLEQVSSATGIVKEAKRLLADTRMQSSDIPSILYKLDNITARDVLEAAKVGDTLALQVTERAGHYLGKAMASITSVIDPQVYIIGGGLSGAGDFLIDLIKRHYEGNVLYVSKGTEIKLAYLGNDAGIYGAAYMVI